VSRPRAIPGSDAASRRGRRRGDILLCNHTEGSNKRAGGGGSGGSRAFRSPGLMDGGKPGFACLAETLFISQCSNDCFECETSREARFDTLGKMKKMLSFNYSTN
jgi:hypothetical protein